MIIHMTKKLSDKIKTGPMQPVSDDKGPLLRWYAHVFRISRYQYILTTNAATYFSTVIQGAGVTDFNSYMKSFIRSLHYQMALNGIEQLFIDEILPHLGCVTLAKTQDRSVISLMNQFISDLKYIVFPEGTTLEEIGDYINHRQSMLKDGFCTPAERIHALRTGMQARLPHDENEAKA
jgi:hypothetical protein